MKKLEPGMLCRVVRAFNPENNGVIVRIVELEAPPFEEATPGARWWRVNKGLIFWSFLLGYHSSNYAPEINLEPINPDHQPADEEWQADFKRLLCGDRQGVEANP